jgi:hypothetical protein
MDLSDDDVQQHAEAVRREVDPSDARDRPCP